MPSLHLSIPQSWNALSAPQIEAVSRIFIDAAKAYTVTGRYNPQEILTRSFFALTGLTVISLPLYDSTSDDSGSTEIPYLGDIEELADSDQSGQSEEPGVAAHPTIRDIYYKCQYTDEKLRNERQMVNGQFAPYRIYLTDLHAATTGYLSKQQIDDYLKALNRYLTLSDQGKKISEPEQPQPKGPLAWLLAPSTLTLFPYPELILLDSKTNENVTLTGPAEMMQDFSWRQYRFCVDFMSFLMKCENSLYDLQRQLLTAKGGKANRIKQQIEQQSQVVNDIRSQFLATLFSRPVEHIDRETGLTVTSPIFLQSQCNDNAYLFKDFPEEKFQAVSFWWQGMMNYLQQQYPKVFRREKVGKAGAQDDNPFSLYTRSITTMIKYTTANEEEVNQTTYTIILQHINDMADENDRIEEMRKGK